MKIDGQQTNPNAEMFAEMAALPKGEIQEDLEPETQEPEAPVEQVAQDQTANTETEPATPAPSEEPIVIDGQTFATAREAYEYSQKKLSESETEKLIMQVRQEAYEQAIQAGATRTEAQQASETVQNEGELSEKELNEFYENPTGFLKRKLGEIRDQVKTEVNRDIETRNSEAALWSEFYKKHPDLEGFESDCKQTLSQHMDTIKALATKDRDKAFDYLATKTRAKFQAYMENLKPRQVLHQSNQGPTPTTNPTPSGVTPTKNEDQPIDFVTQLRQSRNM